MEKKIYAHPEIMIVTNEDLMDVGIGDGNVFGSNETMNPAKPFDPDFRFFDDTTEAESQDETLESFIKKAQYNVWEEEF